MKKLPALLAVGLVSASFIAPAQSSGWSREVKQPYSIAAGYVSDSSEGSATLGPNWVVFKPRRGENRVSLSISDAAGGPVLGKVYFWRTDGRGWSDREVEFCTETDRSIAFRANEKVYVGAFIGSCANGSASVVTTGTVTARFSN